MSLFERLIGTVSSFFQIGGPAGNRIKNVSGALEARNAADGAYVNMRGADPVLDQDLVTKKYLDAVARPYIVGLQFDGDDPLPANTGTLQYYVVTTTGTNAAIGDIIVDDGSGTGTAEVIPAKVGTQIVTTTTLSGGTIAFAANQNYVWTSGSEWLNISPSVSGAKYAIDLDVLLATKTSVAQIPANAVITRCDVKVTSAYNSGVLISVGRSGGTTLLQATTDNFPEVANDYDALQRTDWGTAAALVVTLSGTAATQGAARVHVEYGLPLS
jgi:hypothetical protein